MARVKKTKTTKRKKQDDVDDKLIQKKGTDKPGEAKKEGEQEEIIDPTVYFNPDELDIDLDVNEDPWGGLGVSADNDDDDSF